MPTRGTLAVLHVPLARPAEPGRLEVRNAPAVLAMLDRAVQGCLDGEFGAMVTAPVRKSILIGCRFAFTGHTEYLAQRTGAPLPVMMLASGGMRVRPGHHPPAAGPRGAGHHHPTA